MTDLTSAGVAPIGPTDHVRGDGPDVVLFMDLACPGCAGVWERIRTLSLRICVRHFPIVSKRPRAAALHAAAEAAGLQREEAFWELWDSLYADRGRQDDPHLWARAQAADLDLERFERDRRSPEVADRVRADFRAGVRAGVTGTPAAFVDGAPQSEPLPERLAELADAAPSPGR